MTIDNTRKLVDLRRILHQNPELSRFETATAQAILDYFLPLRPDKIVEKIGGDGLAFHFCGDKPGPTILLRCELDALPIQELNDFSHRSTNSGVSHKCGHDGHMAILAAVGKELSESRPTAGRVVLLYQPAEETGEGAAAVVRDVKFTKNPPDYVFALHNLPGFPLGQVVVRPGCFSAASRGMSIQLLGVSAHAAQPDTGTSPTLAMCEIINRLSNMAPDLIPPGETGFATVIGSRLGEKSFGTTPSRAEIWATLRAQSNNTMQTIVAHLEAMVAEVAGQHDLTVEISYQDDFPATFNAAQAVDIVRKAAAPLPLLEKSEPFPWSEDFGRFTEISVGALFGLGSGENMPELHNPDYDFPDDLIELGAGVFCRIIEQCLAQK